MNKGGIGVGSASIVLVFAVLCLTVFSLITYVVAANDKALVDAEARLVTGFHEADALAERIVAEILDSDETPGTILGIEVEAAWDWESEAEIVYFSSPVSDRRSIFVRLAIHGDSYDIISWRMYDTNEWSFDDSISVWSGPTELEMGDPLDVFTGLDMLIGDDPP